MPHLILELSDNIIENSVIVKQTLAECQELLVAKLPTQLASCKSRAIRYSDYVVGDNSSSNAFAHLTVKILKGRAPELLDDVSKSLHQIISSHFIQSTKELNLGISVVIEELNDNYAK